MGKCLQRSRIGKGLPEITLDSVRGVQVELLKHFIRDGNALNLVKGRHIVVYRPGVGFLGIGRHAGKILARVERCLLARVDRIWANR